MTLSDITLLIKKILVGIMVSLIPFLILFGGLWITHKLLREDEPAPPSTNLPYKK
jgi:hypothetical protein